MTELLPQYAPIPRFGLMSGLGKTTIYEALGRGDLKAIKVGKRTLIDVPAAMVWLRSRPAANIRTGQRAA